MQMVRTWSFANPLMRISRLQTLKLYQLMCILVTYQVNYEHIKNKRQQLCVDVESLPISGVLLVGCISTYNCFLLQFRE